MVYKAEVCMQPGKMLCSSLYSYIFLLQSDYGQTRLNAHIDTHTQRQIGFNFLLCDPPPQTPFFDFALMIFLASIFLLVLTSLLIFSGSLYFAVAGWLLSRVHLFVTPWTAACQSSLSFTIILGPCLFSFPLYPFYISVLSWFSYSSFFFKDFFFLCRPL